MEITLNGEKRKIEGEIDIERLLDLFSLPRQRIAVEVNRSVVRRADWPKIDIAEGDVIEVIHFVGGG
jgi:thiamine biosynthesis protein ThiS